MVEKRRKWLRVLACAAGVLFVLLLTARVWLGGFIARTANAVGPIALGVPVSVESATVDLLAGRAHLKHIEIGNPEGYDTPYLFHLDEILVDLDLLDCLTGKTHIREVVVSGPRAWYHQSFRGNNVSAFLDILNDKYPPPVSGEEKPGDDGKKKKPVVIDRLLVEKGTVGVKLGASLELPLPEIELTDVGKEGAMVPGQVAVLLVQSVAKGILGAVSGVGGLAVDGVKGTGKLAVSGVKALGSAVAGALFGTDDTNQVERASEEAGD